jgi:hypothetical protein
MRMGELLYPIYSLGSFTSLISLLKGERSF